MTERIDPIAAAPRDVAPLSRSGSRPPSASERSASARSAAAAVRRGPHAGDQPPPRLDLRA